MKANKSAISCCSIQVHCAPAPAPEHSVMHHGFGERCCRKGPSGFQQTASPEDPAAEELLCCMLSLTPLVSNLRQYLNIHYSEFHFSGPFFFFNWEKERKTRLAIVSRISVFLQERNEPLQS